MVQHRTSFLSTSLKRWNKDWRQYQHCNIKSICRVNVLNYIELLRVNSSNKITLDYFIQHRENGPGWNSASTSTKYRLDESNELPRTVSTPKYYPPYRIHSSWSTQRVYSQIGRWTVDSAKNDEKERIMRYEQVTKNTTKPMRLIEVRERKRF